MNTLSKSSLVHGAYYEGVDADEYSRVARWNANTQEFLANMYHWEETMLIPMVYEGEKSEYYTDFSPVARIEPSRHELVDFDEPQRDQDR